MTHHPDKDLIGSRFGRSLPSYRRNAVMQRRMAGELVTMIARSGGAAEHIGRVLEVGCGSGILTEAMLSRFRPDAWFANDLVAESSEFVAQVISRHPVGEYRFLHGDIETLRPLPGGLDLVVSNATVQWLHDIGAFFRSMADVLRPGGLLAFSTFSRANMREIALLENISLSYLTTGELESHASACFETVSMAEEERRVEFASPEAVLHHIRQTGVNGLGGRAWSKTRYQHFLRRYRASFSSGSGVYLTYHPVYCCFRRRVT